MAKARRPASTRGPLLVVEIVWFPNDIDTGNEPRTQTYGPWRGRDDGSHLGEIKDFLTAWRDRHGGVHPLRTILTLLHSPETVAGDTPGEAAATRSGAP